MALPFLLGAFLLSMVNGLTHVPSLNMVNGSIVVQLPIGAAVKVMWVDPSTGSTAQAACDLATQCQLSSFQTQILTTVSRLAARLDTEQSRAAHAEDLLNQTLQITAETLSTSLSLESVRALRAESSLGVFSQVFATNAQQASLSSSLSSLSNLERNISSSLALEISRVQASQSGLSVNLTTVLSTETSRALTSEMATNNTLVSSSRQLSTAVQTEANTRSTADASLSSAILATFTNVSQAVNQEVSRALSAESVLSSAIARESSTRVIQIQQTNDTLSAAIALEASRRTSANNSLFTMITSETSRALAAEGSLATTIGEQASRQTFLVSSEASRAVAVERSLANTLSSLNVSVNSVVSPSTNGCASGTRAGLIDPLVYPSIAVCAGSYTGNIGGPVARALCATGWHVCRGNDQPLNVLTFAQATSFTGCYAYDSAHDCNYCSTTCQAIIQNPNAACQVQPGNDADLAGLGAGCPNYETGTTSVSINCITSSRRIDSVSTNWGCDGQPSSSLGVVCCRD
eukprot:m.11588 g.11588  ORF g.11588 m.11588 type:complete len:519 (-) comp5827_c0_seq1:24-1580(-)